MLSTIFLGITLFSIVLTENTCRPEEWRCADGGCIATEAKCDGMFHCQDASDERLSLCNSTRRPMLGLVLHCIEASELYQGVCPELCQYQPQYCSYALLAANGAERTCVIPPFPENGRYVLATQGDVPRSGMADFDLHYFCDTGFVLQGESKPKCVQGNWTHEFPQCFYDCGIPSNNTEDIAERNGRTLAQMPWHVTIYMKSELFPLMRHCGGTLVSPTTVISSAYCFWETYVKGSSGGKLEDISKFTVAVGKQYNKWFDRRDTDAQKSYMLGWKELEEAPSFLAEPRAEYTEMFVSDTGVEFCSNKLHESFRGIITADKTCALTDHGANPWHHRGSGVIVRDETGRHYLRGVVSSYSSAKDLGGTDYFVYTRLVAHEQFLRNTSVVPFFD